MNKIYDCVIDSLTDGKAIVWAEGIVPNMRLKIGIDIEHFITSNIKPKVGLEIEYNRDTHVITLFDDSDPELDAEIDKLYAELLPKLEKFNFKEME